MRNYKNKNLAALLAFFGGIVGLHRFYLGQNGKGFLMIILSIFTMGVLGSIIGVIDSIAFLSMSEEKFDFKYNNPDEIVRRSPRYRSYERRPQTRSFSGNGSSPYRKDRRMDREEYRRKTGEKTSHNKRPKRKPVKNQRQRTRKIRKNDLKTINSLKSAGIEKFKDYDIEGSVRDFKKVLELDPHHVAAHFNLACAYSQLEQPQKTMHHIHMAVEAGFNDFERIKKHDKLAYARIQPEWEEFAKNGFIFDVKEEVRKEEEIQATEKKEPESVQQNEKPDELLEHLKTLKEQREKGIITEVEFEIERRKLMSS